MSDNGTPTVHQAWADVMRSVRAVGKGGFNEQQNFAFRGIEQVQNAVGPALRDHAVTVIPRVLSIDTERYETSRKAVMQGIIVNVEFTVYGPAGDCFTGSAYGQAADSGDKAVTKAQSVALRTFLTQALMIPTEGIDSDAESHERASGPAPDPLRDAKDAVWDASRHAVGPGVDPATKHGTDQRLAALDTILAELGASPATATRDQLRTVFGVLTGGLWKATAAHTEPNVDPYSAHGIEQRRTVLRDALAEVGTKLAEATADHLEVARAVLVTGEVTEPDRPAAGPTGDPGF